MKDENENDNLGECINDENTEEPDGDDGLFNLTVPS